MQGAVAVFVVVVAHFALRRLVRPAIVIVLFHILSLFLDIATFVYCFMHFPYNQCRNGSYSSSSKGCKVDKAAVPIVGVLMYDLSSTALNIRGLFFISSVILLYDFISWHRRGYNSGGGYNSNNGGNLNGSKSRRSRYYY
jgi:energy-coupling factor transporter transmembrane protein EcfT